MERKTSELKSAHPLFSPIFSLSNTVLFFATSVASIKDIKATGYIFIISNHIVFAALLFMRLQPKMKISSWRCSSALDCLSGKKNKKKSAREAEMKKEKQETKRENKLRASHRSLARSLTVVRHLLASRSRTLMRKRSEREKTFSCFFFLFSVSVLSPFAFMPWTAECC